MKSGESCFSVIGTMRVPVRSEGDAFRLTIAGAIAIGAALLLGWLTEPLVGVALLLVVLALAGIAYLRAAKLDRPMPLREAAAAAHPHAPSSAARRLLVIANETLSGEPLHELILGDDGEDVEIDILAPVLSSHLHLGVSDVDRELAQAAGRLQRSLAWAREHGIIAHGEVGDPSTTTAIADELRDFGADEVIVVTHPRERETWQERGELERLRRELDIPVTHVELSVNRGSR